MEFNEAVLSPQYFVDGVDADTLGVDLDQSPADIARFAPAMKFRVKYVACVVTETSAGDTTTGVVKFDKRPTAGSDTSRGDGDIGHIKVLTTAAGKCLFDRAGHGEVIEPGEEVIFQLVTQATGTGAAGHVIPFIVGSYMPQRPESGTNMVETT